VFSKDGFDARFHTCVDEMRDFIQPFGLTYEGNHVLDIGSGDGIIDLGMALKANCRVTGIDTTPTERGTLVEGALMHGVTNANDADLNFIESIDGLSNIETDSIDHAFSRDVFEHVFSPVPLLRAIDRVLKPGGTLYIQIWPLWHSEWGAHLFDKFKPWSHHVKSRQEILEAYDFWPPAVESYDSCARTSIDDLQRACTVAGFRALRIEFYAPIFGPSPETDHLSWTTMGIAGIKVLLQKSSDATGH
jgi:SAM-dependent methyltransferase